MKKFTVSQNTSLRQFTDATYPQGSFYLSALLRSGDVRVNGVRVRSVVPLKTGDEVVYFTSPKMEAKRSHSCIYADEHMYVADKESGVESSALACELGLFAVHRLDRNTCGLIVLARDARTENELNELFKSRSVTKQYICICKDAFARPSAELSAYLYKDEIRGLVTVSDRPKSGFVPIYTGYTLLERRNGLAKVLVDLHTGKTHQIRAHLAHIGCPVLGDNRYGDVALNRAYGLARQQLCSHRLAFSLGGRDYEFFSRLAPDFPAGRSK